MRLNENVLKQIHNKRTRLRLAVALDLTEQAIIKYIKNNNENLTKAAALKVIREDTGLTDADILESNTVETIV